MNVASVNWLAVVVCVIFSMVSGMVWYHPRLFYPAWRKGLGKSEQEMADNRPGPMHWTLTILASLLEAVAVAVIVNALDVRGAAAGAVTGLLLWIGFIAPTNLVNKMFAGHGLKVWAIEAGNHLLNMIVFGAVLGAWR